jgi:nucleoside-diphosphate-sugar epimerase
MTGTSHKTALVAGATGLVGRAVVETLETRTDWTVIAVSRGRPDFLRKARHVGFDLTDPDAFRDKATALADVTHVFFAAYKDIPDLAGQVAPNLAMLENTIGLVATASTSLRHVSLVTGAKHYGSHLGPWKTPAREDDPRVMSPNFYYAQEDFLRDSAGKAGWTWSVVRPGSLAGIAPTNQLNLVNLLAVYATISRELGLPLRFPGSAEAYASVYQVTSADLLARAMVWSATTPASAGHAFNVVNGDLCRWESLWPRIADYFDLPVAPPQQIDLAEMMADKEDLWTHIARRHGLAEIPFNLLANWSFGNYCFRIDYDMISDIGKLRRHGFTEAMDSAGMFLDLFDRLRVLRIIP